jgi:hypothetical protein
MAPPGFFSNLAFRPQQGKRKRAGSLPRDDNRPKPANHATVEEDAEEYSTQQPKSEEKSEEDPHTAKRRRFNDPGDEKPVNDSQGVANPNLASDLDDLKLRGRVIRRRRAPVDLFIPKKPRGVVKVRRPRPRQKPVCGRASFLTAAEQQLSDALQTKGAGVAVVDNLIGLPKVALDPAVGPEERSKEEVRDGQVPVHYDANDLKHNDEGIPVSDGGVPVRSVKHGTVGTNYYDEQASVHSDDQDPADRDRECTCQSVADDTNTLVHCDQCEKVYHPVCVGKERQGSALYTDARREKAMLKDADFYRKNGGFTCSNCDNKALEAKQHWGPDELKAESKRRNKLFLAKHKLVKSEVEPQECDNCTVAITGKGYQCRYCQHDFDLCFGCFMDPSVSSKHQHAAGDMKLR